MMGALPSFAQMQTPANGLAGSPLGTIGSEQADLLGFGALLSQSAPNAALTESNAEQGAGHFQDVNVILQLLRSSQSDMESPSPLSDGQAPAAASPSTGSPSAPLAALPFDPSQFGQATTQDLLDMAAQLAEQSAAPAAPPTINAQIMAAQQAATLLPGKQPLTTSDTPTDVPADTASLADPAEASDHASTPARQQAEALEILLSLTNAAPTGASTAAITAASLAAAAGISTTPSRSTTSTNAPLAALDQPSDSSASVSDLLMPPTATLSRKPVGQSSASWTPAQAENRSVADAVMAAPSAPMRGMTASATPLTVPSSPASTAAPAADLGAAMSVMITTGAANAGPVQATSAAEAAAAVPEHWLDMHADDAWIEQLAKDIAATKSATGDISFRLMPRHLGRLDVSMMQSEQGVSVHMDTQHEQTAAIVTAAQGRLVDELRQQGVRVAGADVTHTPQDMTRQNSQGQGRSSQNELHHLIETASERLPETDSDDKGTADRHGRFA
jgi:flagellar hook-length control protein FliK